MRRTEGMTVPGRNKMQETLRGGSRGKGANGEHGSEEGVRAKRWINH